MITFGVLFLFLNRAVRSLLVILVPDKFILSPAIAAHFVAIFCGEDHEKSLKICNFSDMTSYISLGCKSTMYVTFPR